MRELSSSLPRPVPSASTITSLSTEGDSMRPKTDKDLCGRGSRIDVYIVCRSYA